MASMYELLKEKFENDWPKNKAPRIYHGGEDFDLSKRWYVYYMFRHPMTKKYVRQPNIINGINRDYKTRKERMFHLEKLRAYMLELLENGFNPYEEHLPKH